MKTIYCTVLFTHYALNDQAKLALGVRKNLGVFIVCTHAETRSRTYSTLYTVCHTILDCDEKTIELLVWSKGGFVA